MNHLTATHYFCWRMGAKRTSGTFIGTALKNIVKHFQMKNVKLSFIFFSKWNRLFSWQPKDSTVFYKNDSEGATDIYDQFQVCLQIWNFRWLLNFERRTTVFNFVKLKVLTKLLNLKTLFLPLTSKFHILYSLLIFH